MFEGIFATAKEEAHGWHKQDRSETRSRNISSLAGN